jgi:hypothetical protein
MQHAKAIAELETDEGIQKAEVRWYEHPKSGKTDFKYKNEVYDES